MRKPIKRLRKSNAAWAVETGDKGRRPGYLGRFYFNDLRTGRCVPLHTSGCHHALFDTRGAARAALALMKPNGERHAFPKARVVRVSVTVTTIGRG